MKNWMPDWLLNKAHAAKRNVFINELHDLEHERAFMEGVQWAYNEICDDEDEPERGKSDSKGGAAK